MKRPPIVQESLQVEDSDAPSDMDLVSRVDALVSTAYTHHGASYANRYIESD
jgi:hypothetical protein